MRLEDYWGVGPKTSDLLEAELGAERAIQAIEASNVRVLSNAGLSRGRATRILRQANGGEGMAVLATRDSRSVYKSLLDIASNYAVTPDAADRIRVMTPVRSPTEANERLDSVMAAVTSWDELTDSERESVVTAFEEYDGSERTAVETALALQSIGTTEGAFAPVADIDSDALNAATGALGKLDDNRVAEGADDTLDRLRTELAAVERMESGALDVLEAVQSDDLRNPDEFRESYVEHVASETDIEPQRIRSATVGDATDATDFVGGSLRELVAEQRESVEERESTVAEELETRIEDTRDAIDAAVSAVNDLAVSLSLARFADEFSLSRPEFVDEGFAVEDARNLFLATGSGDVQPITYGIGEHGVAGPPRGDRVTVLTGANSGGKTTLLETLCQVALLAQMGLPVPADRAQLSVSDTIVFHRRHASFNAGVLESTLRNIVPPLTNDGRTLMLVDEFEAITEPGSAANLLHGLVGLTVDRGALGVFVTHLAEDLNPLPDQARKDGIFAEGLNDDLELLVDYQPRFDTVGKSTPEFIVSRLIASANDRAERAGYDILGRAVGEAAVQQTLSSWAEGE
ncbi:MutS-related protein [Haladaptatus caseinilyticus]|uniref:MutS-related protein n=1 Tax=Haladaptatus caseinilyticus TaxID=2993314 RepID=UPI00224B5EFF|nr:DNA mismatch repair protein [Haladaptatus caseinilyticus]